MSVKQNGVLITAPLFGTGRETVGEFPGYSCGYCQGNGWFYFDYSFGVASDWTHTSGRQYGTWNMFYTFISQANYILDNEEAVKDDAEWQNVLGQAYAIRAYSYYCLYESFCQGNYTENKDKPGVPVYTKGTNKETEGVGRGTIEGLFTQINGDFQRAVDYLADRVEQLLENELKLSALLRTKGENIT